MEHRLLKVDEAATYLNFHPETLYELARKGVVPAVKQGRAIRFDRVELDRWIDKKISDAKEEASDSPWSYLNRGGPV